jgi:hypothetical protein
MAMKAAKWGNRCDRARFGPLEKCHKRLFRDRSALIDVKGAARERDHRGGERDYIKK